MPSNPEELEQALKSFRQDVLKAFADIRVQIAALRFALLGQNLVSADQWKAFRTKADEGHDRYEDHYAQTIALIHEIREKSDPPRHREPIED
jgi:hypothetical protein